MKCFRYSFYNKPAWYIGAFILFCHGIGINDFVVYDYIQQKFFVIDNCKIVACFKPSKK
jgi:hypothetical protein